MFFKTSNLSLESNNKSIKVPNKIFNIGFGKPVNLDYLLNYWKINYL